MLYGIKRKLKEEPELSNAFAGGLAGAITATVVCPLDVLKTRLQVQRKAAVHYVGIGGESLAHRSQTYESIAAGGLSKIMREEGMRGLYRGLTPTLMALLPNWAVYFSVYERLKTTIGGRVGPRHANSAGVHMAAAACAGAATMVITNPLWVIKTRLQTQNMGIRMGASRNPAMYRGTLDALVRIAREEGLAGLYSGLGPSLMGVMHVVIQFPMYESMKKYFIANPLLPHDGPEKERLTLTELVLASAASKMVASTATYPHEVVRSRMHIAGTGAFTGLMRTCKQIYREDRMGGFYRGCLTNLLRTTPAAAVTFTSFEVINRRIREWAATAQDPPQVATSRERTKAALREEQQAQRQSPGGERPQGSQALQPDNQRMCSTGDGAAMSTVGPDNEGLPDLQRLESHMSSQLGGTQPGKE